MPAVQKCLCCGLHQGAIFAGNYAIIAYGAAVGATIWWIVHKAGDVAIPVYLLLCLYFMVFGISVMLVLSLASEKKTNALMTWLMVMLMLLLPECGLNMWTNIFILGIHGGFGLGLLIFYLVRVIINVICMVCVHALYSTWSEEEMSVRQRINQLHSKSQIFATNVGLRPPVYVWQNPMSIPLMYPSHFPAIGGCPKTHRSNTSMPMLTYPGHGEVGNNRMPMAPPRKKGKMVSSGETISYQTQDINKRRLDQQRLEPPPSRDSAISSESYSGEDDNYGKMKLVPAQVNPYAATMPGQVVPIPMAWPPVWGPIGPTKLEICRPPIVANENPYDATHFLPPLFHSPVPPSRKTVNKVDSIYGTRPMYPNMLPLMPPGANPPPPIPYGPPMASGPKIYELIGNRGPPQKLHNRAPVFGADPGFENFMIRAGQLQTYRPKTMTEMSVGKPHSQRRGQKFQSATSSSGSRYNRRSKSIPSTRSPFSDMGPRFSSDSDQNRLITRPLRFREQL